jgi:hypothetical protein
LVLALLFFAEVAQFLLELVVGFEFGKLFIEGRFARVNEVGIGFHAVDAAFELFKADEGIVVIGLADARLRGFAMAGVDVALDEDAVFIAGGLQLVFELLDILLVLGDQFLEVGHFGGAVIGFLVFVSCG